MSTSSLQTVTRLLAEVCQGDAAAQDRLWRLVYDELHVVAERQLACESPGRTLQPTSLIHEVFIKLAPGPLNRFENRRHFFAAAARAMRQIRIDDARRRRRVKRGEGWQKITLADQPAVFGQDPAEVLSIDEALRKLEKSDPRKAEVVSLRYFAGLTEEETAEAMDLSRRTVQSEWRFAKAWLHRELANENTGAE